MSDLVLHKTTSTENETANANSHFNEQEDSNTATDMDLVKQKETVKPGPLKIAANSTLLCMDIENSQEEPADDNADDRLVAVPELKLHVTSQRAKRRKYTILGVYDYLFGPPQRQPPDYSRYTSQLWRQQQPVPQPQQTIWTQYGPGSGYYHRGQNANHGENPNQGQYPNQGNPYPHGDGGYQGAFGYDGGGPLLYDPGSRNSFVRLVMGLVLLMLLATAAFLAIVLTMVVLIIVNCAMMCSPCARRPPCNFVCLALATASMSVFAARVTCHYRTEIILYAVIATTTVVLVCVLLAFSSFDFTSYMLYIIAIATAFSVLAIIILVTLVLTGTFMKPVIIVVLSVGTFIQIVLLTMELQMVLGGKTIELSESDYALAAFLIYTSILDIFTKLVHVLGLSSN
nr:uncharacterized protein LOC110377281 isoform X2 [Helicoverpa armigera]